MDVTYESWRTHDREITHRERFQTSYKFSAPQGLTTKRDSIIAASDGLTFVHQNGEQTIFDVTVTQQQMDAVKDRLYNPLRNLIFGGRLHGDQFVLKGTTQGRYASSDYQGWTYTSKRPAQRHAFTIALATKQGSFADWLSLLRETERQIQTKRDWKQTRDWWHQFWQRSYVEMKEGTLARNYTLFRYMLGCNSRGGWPTKFNGGLFTFDPEYVEKAPEYRLTPDYRNWGGGVHTSQNQRLVYWPMLKNGDFDMLCPQLDFYLRISHELPLKRLIGGGYERVYDIGPRFRNEGMDEEHLPEHVAMESYAAYQDYEEGMALYEEMIKYVCKETWGTLQFEHEGMKVDLDCEWPKITFADIIKDNFDIDVFNPDIKKIHEILRKNGVKFDEKAEASRLLDYLWKIIRKKSAGPFWLIHEPVELSPLAKKHAEDPRVTERFHPVIFGTLYIFALLGLVLKLLSDITYCLVDPRINFDKI